MSLRLPCLLAAAAALLLACTAGAAPAAHTFPKLQVRDNGTSVVLEITHGDLDDPAARLTIHAPGGYDVTLSRPAGTTIGSAEALVTAPDLGLAQIVVAGHVEVRPRDGTYSFGGSPLPLARAAELCTGTATHAAYWVLRLQGSGQTLELPLFVDRAPPDAAAFASATIQACLPPPDLSRGAPERAPFGFELARAAVTVNGVFRATGAGERRWRMTETEYAPGRGTPSPADTAETQALVYVGAFVTLRRPIVTVRRGIGALRLRGRAGIPAAANPVYRLFAGRRRASLRAATKLQPAGRVLEGTLRLKLARRPTTVYLQARAAVETLGLGPSFCSQTFGKDVPCVYATRTGLVARSATFAVVLPAGS